MKSTTKLVIGLFAFVMAGSLSAATKKIPAPAAPSTPDAAMMAHAMQMGTPGVNHQLLASLVGKWNCTVLGWMKDGDKPQESHGTADNSMVLGGRYLKQDFKGDWAGQPFEGTGYTGYDNLREEFQSVWLDNMSTGMMQSAGTYDATTKTINTSGTFSCPMTNEKARWVRSEIKFVDNDTNLYVSYFKGTDGKEFKAMEITYKRVK